jgi:hypothetical protein
VYADKTLLLKNKGDKYLATPIGICYSTPAYFLEDVCVSKKLLESY